MKKLVSILSISGLMFISNFAFTGETYENEEAKFKITFPAEFESEKEVDEDGKITYSLSCGYGDMLLIGNAFIFTEPVSEDDNLVAEAGEIFRVAGAFESKVKIDDVLAWNVGDDTGFINPMKCKGDYKGYIGNYYVIVQGSIEYQFLVLGPKKTYDYNCESRFINSFEILP